MGGWDLERQVAAAFGLVASSACVVAIGIILRRLVKHRPRVEMLIWAYLTMGLATTLPHHVHRMSIDTRSFPGPSSGWDYLSSVVPDFVALSLAWPLVTYVLLAFAPPDSPVPRSALGELAAAVVSAGVLAPLITAMARRSHRRQGIGEKRADTM